MGNLMMKSNPQAHGTSANGDQSHPAQSPKRRGGTTVVGLKTRGSGRLLGRSSGDHVWFSLSRQLWFNRCRTRVGEVVSRDVVGGVIAMFDGDVCRQVLSCGEPATAARTCPLDVSVGHQTREGASTSFLIGRMTLTPSSP
jgi:hypothetical protein